MIAVLLTLTFNPLIFVLTLDGLNHTTMESIRQKQISELLRRQFSMVLLEEGPNIFNKAMVSVTRCIVSPDLATAKMYLSVFNTDNKQEIMLMLDEEYHRLRFALANKVGKQLRRMPELKFFLDETLDEFFRMDKILNDLRADKQMGKDEEE